MVWLNIDGLYEILSLHDCLQFGALISAVDPGVCVCVRAYVCVCIHVVASVCMCEFVCVL